MSESESAMELWLARRMDLLWGWETELGSRWVTLEIESELERVKLHSAGERCCSASKIQLRPQKL